MTVSDSRRKHYHKAMHDELSGVLLDDCAACGESWRNTDVHISNPNGSRAEPSRGAPDAALQALRVWEVDTDAWPTAREGNAFIDGFQAGRAGHVVLLEALRRLANNCECECQHGDENCCAQVDPGECAACELGVIEQAGRQ